MSARSVHMQLADLRLLEAWAREVSAMFRGEMPYLVGSSLLRPDYRDVDVRLIVEDVRFAKLKKRVHIQQLGLAVSLWGQRATGLPIDFQVQQRTEANRIHDGQRRPLDMPKKEYDA